MKQERTKQFIEPKEMPSIDGAIMSNLSYLAKIMLDTRMLKEQREATGRAMITADKISGYDAENIKASDLVVRLRRNLLAMASLQEMLLQCHDGIRSEINQIQELCDNEHKQYVKMVDKMKKDYQSAERMRKLRNKKE